MLCCFVWFCSVCCSVVFCVALVLSQCAIASASIFITLIDRYSYLRYTVLGL